MAGCRIKKVAVRVVVAWSYAAVVVGVPGCPEGPGSVNEPAPTTGEQVSFSQQLQPIFDANCTTCHRVGGFADQEGIALKLTANASRGNLVNMSSVQDQSLTLVVPGDSGSSLLFLKVSQDMPPVGATMPLVGQALPSGDLALIRDWIDQGAQDN